MKTGPASQAAERRARARGRAWPWTGAAPALIALLGFSACSPRQESTNPPPETPLADLVLKDGKLGPAGGANLFTGLAVERYPDGALKSRSAISNGVMWGLSEGWHTNGRLQVREQFRAGVSEGVRTKWDTNGARLSEAMIVEGRLNGIFRRWHPNGALAEEVEMKDDQPEGAAKAWHPSGCLRAEMRMAAGRIVEQKSWKDGDVPGAPPPVRPQGRQPFDGAR